MGSWFSNIHFRKNNDTTKASVSEYLIRFLTEHENLVRTTEQDADTVVAIVAGIDRQWISIYSDVFTHDDPESCAAITKPMSTELHTDVLGIACFDSDYMYLNLINTEKKTDAWVGIGRGADVGIKRRSNLTAWKGKVSDHPLFSSAAKKSYVCADEFLTEAASFLNLPTDQSSGSLEHLKYMDSGNEVSYLYFKSPNNSTPKSAVRLTLWGTNDKLPCLVGRESDIMVINVGEESKGLALYFLGPYVENDEITFSDVRLELDGKTIPVTLTKMHLPDGQWAYGFHDDQFEIPPKVPNRLEKWKRYQLTKRRWIIIRFTPQGNPRKTLDITVALVPDKNPAGQIKWNVWESFGSKQAFMKWHNKIWKRVMLYEEDPNNCLPLLKETDFD